MKGEIHFYMSDKLGDRGDIWFESDEKTFRKIEGLMDNTDKHKTVTINGKKNNTCILIKKIIVLEFRPTKDATCTKDEVKA